MEPVRSGAINLEETIDEAGTFLIDHREYEDCLALYRAAAERFPETAMFHAGRGCCAGHLDSDSTPGRCRCRHQR